MQPPSKDKPVEKSFSTKSLVSIILVLLTLGGILFGYYFFQKYQKVKQNPTLITQEETKLFVTQVGKLMELPKDETPSIATVTDKEKLKDQAFFKNAENGDKVLIYTKAGKAILYRPKTDRIVEVAPISIAGNEEGNTNTKTNTNINTNTTATAELLKIALYNGTNIAGLANTAEIKLKDELTNIKITAKVDAQKKDYAKTIVVDLSGANKDKVAEVAKILGGEVGALPQGETKPDDADIAVFLAE